MRKDIEKVRARAREWNRAHRDLVRVRARAYYALHSGSIASKMADRRDDENYKAANRERQRAWRLRYPWYDAWQGARQRCVNPKHPRYSKYGGRGILFLLSKADMAFLWARDNASRLYDPTIDRKDNDGPYSLENCQILERSANSSKQDAVINGKLLSI